MRTGRSSRGTISQTLPLCLLTALVPAASVLTSCAPNAPPAGFESLDLVARGEWTAEEEGSQRRVASPEPVQAFCGDETFLGLRLEPGEEIATSFVPGERAALHLGGCVSLPKGDAPSSRPPSSQAPTPVGRLEVVIEGGGGKPTRRDVPMAAVGPWRDELDLGSWAGSDATLRLRSDLEGGTVWLREVRQVSEPVWTPRSGRRDDSPSSSPVPGETPSPAVLSPAGPVPRGASRRHAPKGASVGGAHGLQVLFISVDTLREDAVSALGGLGPDGETVATPGLDRLVAESQVFDPHYASAGWTRPSHGTLLTGLSPVACGALGDKGALRPGLRTLAERFRDAGYRTAALFYDIGWFHPRFGFDRGFESYRLGRWRLDRAVPVVASWISEHRDEPFLFFFHTFEPHGDARWLPYESAGTTRETVRRRFGVPGYGCREGHCATDLLVALDQGRLAPLPREREILRFLYARSAAFVDEQLGRLFDTLRRLGLYDDLLIVFTSDHGEVLLDHGQLLHGKPWEEVIRVPLAVKWPGGELAGTRVTTPTASEDLVPTLLEAAGLDASDLPGRSLRGRRRAVPVFVGHNFRAVIYEGMKAVLPDPDPPRLYDLRADPRESHDLARERPGDLERLRGLIEARGELDRELARRYDRAATGEEPGLTREEKRRLQALGYLRGKE